MVAPVSAHESDGNVGAAVPPTPHENVRAELVTVPSVLNQTSMAPEYDVTVPGLVDPVRSPRLGAAVDEPS